jgi:hypothetical protein
MRRKETSHIKKTKRLAAKKKKIGTKRKDKKAGRSVGHGRWEVRKKGWKEKNKEEKKRWKQRIKHSLYEGMRDAENLLRLPSRLQVRDHLQTASRECKIRSVSTKGTQAVRN